MSAFGWFVILLTVLVPALCAAAWIAGRQRRASVRAPGTTGWLTDQMVREIIHTGRLGDEAVPEEALDLEEIAREEERFWSEKWEEPGPYWE